MFDKDNFPEFMEYLSERPTLKPQALPVTNHWYLVAATFDIQHVRTPGDGGPLDPQGNPAKLTDMLALFLESGFQKIEENAAKWRADAILNQKAMQDKIGLLDPPWVRNAIAGPSQQMFFPRPPVTVASSIYGAWGNDMLTFDGQGNTITKAVIDAAPQAGTS